MLAQDNENSAVEATVRGFEQAVQDYDLAKVNSLLTPEARWIENSLQKIDAEWQWFDKAKTAGVRTTYWVTISRPCAGRRGVGDLDSRGHFQCG